MRVSHIRWSATATRIYTKQSQKKKKKGCWVPAVGEQRAVSPGGDGEPRLAQPQPGWAPQGTHQPCKRARHHRARCRHVSTFCNMQSWWRAREHPVNGLGRRSKILLPQPLLSFQRQRQTASKGQTLSIKEMLLSFRGCYSRMLPKSCPDRLLSKSLFSF